MKVNRKTLSRQIEELKRKPANVNAKEEAQHLENLINGDEDISERLVAYEDPVVVGVGGSGVILQATYSPSGGYRALKFPRKKQYTDAKIDPSIVEIDPERQALEKVSHQNITRLYEAFSLPNAISYCMITQYIPGGSDNTLDNYTSKLVCTPECQSNPEQLNRALKSLVRIIYHIGDALLYLHNEVKLLHSDIKPENILISPTGVPYVTDLGFARELVGHAPDEDVEIGFTWKYAHPRLQDPHRGAKVTNVPQKAKTPIKGGELSAIFDIFAFGRTLQEVLGLIFIEYGERIQSNYIFDYLHVLASRCLDGKNGQSPPPKEPGEFISDAALGMPTALYTRSAFTTFDEVQACLERLLGVRRLEDELEETDRWYGSTIKVTESGSTILTSRVASLINHPALQRLRMEKQLGMLDTVYPTATHTRFQHALGSYHAATLYVSALYYDPDNPLFRALVDIEKCKALFVAALIHDIGQTAYGHELEEIDDEQFDHKLYVHAILNSKSFRDDRGMTLREVIESKIDTCWGLPLVNVLGLFKLQDTSVSPFLGVLHDILDSQIDADKCDYLVRDTVEGRVSYGFGLDLDRFLRSLTTFVRDDGTLRLALKQKGAPAGEAFAQARYQLYQSMYWQHTFRATKTMLTEAIKLIQEELEHDAEQDLLDSNPIRTAYIRHVIGAADYAIGRRAPPAKKPAKRPSRKPTISEKIETRLLGGEPDVPVAFRDDRFMAFLLKLSATDKSRGLLYDLVRRNYYKRILEVSPSRLSVPDWQTFRDRFKNNRSKIQLDVEAGLLNALRSKVQSEATVRASLELNTTLAQIATTARKKPIFLVDVPLRGWFASNEPPVYVSDYKRRHFRADAADRGYERRSEFWLDTLGSAMKAAAYIRVFSEPQIHGIITSVMDATEIFNAVSDAIPELKAGR